MNVGNILGVDLTQLDNLVFCDEETVALRDKCSRIS